MKKYCFLLGFGLLLIGCTEQEVQSEAAVDKPAEKVAVNVSEPAKCNDVALENAVRQLVQGKMAERNCDRGLVYVVETRTGHIKANISLERTGTAFTPWKDTYTKEQSTTLGGATYLALLSTGKISSDDVIDTEYGIYKDVRDHNWMKGGFGPITLEQALGYRSLVAFAKAKDSVFADRTAEYDHKVSRYLAGQPNSSMGILAFYNAVANGGRMLKLVNEGNSVTVLDEQIEDRKYIEELQRGLNNAVSIGFYKKAGRPYTCVAAAGRTFKTTGKTWRMELCGYFPADNPMYTIMVVMEKDRLPAAAGSICGPIMAGTIDLVVDRYNLRSKVEDVERQPQSVVVEVDTIG